MLGTAIAADPPMTNLRIEVKTLSDKPIERASVIVKFVEGRSIIKFGKQIHTSWQMKTNQEGVAKIPPLPQGKILIQVISKGYQTYGETIQVEEPEKVVEVKLKPPQPQYSAH
ncbi:MAG: carboxypeptidase regulatory-like domain-containing protein [Bryobacterales bacterium]|nr:carboxypeptidase regulatory-like domain-containing protein [Bryobacterales bacterium]